MNAVPGGHFPLPSEVAHLMSRIPPPHCFNVSAFHLFLCSSDTNVQLALASVPSSSNMHVYTHYV